MTDPAPELHLASSSPRRAEILTTLGVRFSARGADIDERRQQAEPPENLVVRLAGEKAAAARESCDIPVLAADTAVVIGDAVFGKPQDEADAVRMLARLSGGWHQVMSGVAVISEEGPRTALSVSRVRFREILPEEASAYWHSGEPRDKAGAYAIQGLGGVFVSDLRGSYSNVVGLPVFETAWLLKAAGLDLLRRRAAR